MISYYIFGTMTALLDQSSWLCYLWTFWLDCRDLVCIKPCLHSKMEISFFHQAVLLQLPPAFDRIFSSKSSAGTWEAGAKSSLTLSGSFYLSFFLFLVKISTLHLGIKTNHKIMKREEGVQEEQGQQSLRRLQKRTSPTLWGWALLESKPPRH